MNRSARSAYCDRTTLLRQHSSNVWSRTPRSADQEPREPSCAQVPREITCVIYLEETRAESQMDHVHVKSRSASKSNPTKMACEKASRRLRTILVRASRLGVSTSDVARLPAAKKLIPQRDHGWKLAVFLLLMFGGGVIVALVCTARKGCSKLEDIVS